MTTAQASSLRLVPLAEPQDGQMPPEQGGNGRA